MKTNQGSERIGQSAAGGEGARLGRGLDHERVIGFYLSGCVALTVIAAALLLSSCGGGHESQVASEPGTPVVTEEVTVPAVANGATNPAMSASTGRDSSLPQSVDADTKGLPPEIALGDVQSVVTPGEAITVTVYGTPDVTEMALWDGINDRQALVHDSGTDTWQVDYRVPLRPKAERLGLSVTAKNEQGRWRRVWHFLQIASDAQFAVEPAAPAHVAEVDSLESK